MTWPLVQLGQVAEFINGAAFKPEDWGESGMPIVRIQNLTDPSKPYNRTRRVVSDRVRVHRGELLVSWSATLGVFEWEREEDGLVNQHIFRVVPNDAIVVRSYLKHMLGDALLAMRKHAHGATMLHVNRGEFLATAIPLPPLPEQRRIASILDQADELRAQRRQTLALLKKQAESEFRDVTDRAAVEGWPTVRLGEVADLQGGLQVSKSREANPVTVPYLRVANVYRSTLDLSQLKTMQVTEAEFARVRLAEGDLLLVEGHGNPLEVGRAARWSGSPSGVVHQNHLIRARVHTDRLNSHYLEALLNSSVVAAHWGRVAKTTSGLNTINMTNVREVPVLLPPLPVQRTVAARLGDMAILKRKRVDHLGRLDELFASLQYKAFRGAL